MPDWKIQLLGEEKDLSLLPNKINCPECSIKLIEHEYLLGSVNFEQLNKIEEVRKEADGIVIRINQAMKLTHSSWSNVKFSTIYSIDEKGNKDIIICPNPLTLKFEIPGVIVTIKDTPCVSLEQKAFQLSKPEEAVFKALKFNSLEHSPPNLYKIYEIIEEDMNGNIKWVSKDEIKRFKDFANDPNISGDDARHATKGSTVPKNPMSSNKAKQMIEKLLREWISYKFTKSKK